MLLIGCAYAALRSARVQTYLTGKLAAYFSKELGATVSIGGVDIEFFNKVILEDVYVEDQLQAPILKAESLKIRIDKINLKKNEFIVNNLTLSNTNFYLARYADPDGLNIQFIIDYFSTSDTSSSGKAPGFIIKELELHNSSFTYNDYRDSLSGFGVDYSHLFLQQVNGRFSEIIFNKDTISSKINKLSFHDHSGFVLSNLNADFKISPSGMEAKNLSILTPHTKLKAHLNFYTESYRDYNDFIHKVTMKGQFENSKVSLKDISYFAPQLEGINQYVYLSGDARGTVDDLKGKNISIQYATQTHFKGDFSFTGLPNIDETFIHLKVKELTSIKRDIEMIPLPPFTTRERVVLPSNIATLGKVGFTGDFTGFLNDFVAYGDFTTALGNISSDISLRQDTIKKVVSYKGKLKTFDFNAGLFAGVSDLGKISMDVKVDGSGLTKSKLNLNVEGSFNSLTFRNYTYHGIKAEGKLLKNIFNGKLSVDDENIVMNFDGNVDFSNELPFLDFTATIDKANLSAINLYKPGSDVSLATTVVFKISGNNIDNLSGNIAALNTKYSEKGKVLNMESIDLIASEQRGIKSLKLYSSIADASVEGKFNYDEFGNSFRKMMDQYLPSLIKEKQQVKVKEQDFVFYIETKDTKGFTELFLPQVSFDKSMFVSGKFNSWNNAISLALKSEDFSIFNKRISNLEISSKTESGSLQLQALFSKVSLSDSVVMKNVAISSSVAKDTIDWNLNWNNHSKERNQGNISSFISFTDYPVVKMKIKPSEVFVQDSLWLVSRDNEILFDSTDIKIHSLLVSNNFQVIKLDGAVSKTSSEKLNIVFSHFNIANFNPLLKNNDVSFGGYVDGAATVSNVYSNLVFSSSLAFKGLTFNNEKIGDGSVVSIWDSRKESIGLNGKFYRGNIPTLAFTGFYYPNHEKDNLDLEIQLEKTQLKFIEPYAKDLVSDISGIATGEMFLKGSVSQPIIDGKLYLQKVSFLVDYLNTQYTFSNEVIFKANKIEAKNLTLFDSKGNSAVVNAKVNHKYFTDYRFDININANNLFCLNTSEKQNKLYYGTAYASGQINIYGDVKDIVIDITAKTEKGTVFNIPLENAKEVSENKFVRFVNKDTTKVIVKETYAVDLSGIKLFFDLDVTPDAEVQIIFDSKAGDIIRSNGSGNIKMDINTLGQFEIFGTYTINSGDYLFTLENVINKRFKVEQGGTIGWNGSPYDANINLSAIYKVRTNLKDLLQDTTREELRRRIPIDVKLMMTDKLLNPTIKFAIELPKNVDEKTANEVKSVINPDDEQEVNRQVFALLILNRFMPDPNKTNYAGSDQINSGLGANASELLSNQLSNWLSNSFKFIDLGVKYKAGNEVNQNEVEVALSTQLFNERIVIDGNVGNSGNQSASNIVGDVNVEYKISKDGKLRVKAFNESNDYNILSNNSPYTQGVGIFFREEFENFSDLIKKYKDKLKRKKEEVE